MGRAPESAQRSGGVAHARGLRTTLALGLLVLGAGDLAAIDTVLLPRYLARHTRPGPAATAVPPTAARVVQAPPSPGLDSAPAVEVGVAEGARPPIPSPITAPEPVKTAKSPTTAHGVGPSAWPRLLFPQNVAWLSPEARAALDRLADYLKQHPAAKAVLEGHTDDQGEPDVNHWLSQNRAMSAKQRLVTRGIDPARIETRGFGATRPLVPAHTPQARAQNRRVEITVRERID